MIIGNSFEGDNHEWVKDIQHQSYDITPIFRAASRAYRYAEAVLDQRTELGKLVNNTQQLDHRTLQGVHDHIAAAFRKIHAKDFALDLFDTKNTEQITIQWQNFYHNAIEELCLTNAEFVRLVLQAVIYKNLDERGKQAEEKIDILLKIWFC